MNKSIKKKSLPLTVTYGINPEVAIPLFSHVDRSVSICADWITLHFGWDEKWRELVFAVTETDTMLLSASPPLHLVSPRSPTRPDWVYAVDGLPYDFLDERMLPTSMSYGGFKITFGDDLQEREFLTIDMPNGHFTWLFRNPDSESSGAWSPRRAIVVEDAMVVHPHWCAGVINIAKKSKSTGDDELDEMLARLAS